MLNDEQIALTQLKIWSRVVNDRFGLDISHLSYWLQNYLCRDEIYSWQKARRMAGFED